MSLYTCLMCGEFLKLEADLEIHILKVHSSILSSDTLNCVFCPFNSNLETMEHHLQTVHEDSQRECLFCPFISTTDKLEIHLEQAHLPETKCKSKKRSNREGKYMKRNKRAETTRDVNSRPNKRSKASSDKPEVQVSKLEDKKENKEIFFSAGQGKEKKTFPSFSMSVETNLENEISKESSSFKGEVKKEAEVCSAKEEEKEVNIVYEKYNVSVFCSNKFVRTPYPRVDRKLKK